MKLRLRGSHGASETCRVERARVLEDKSESTFSTTDNLSIY